MKYFLYLLLIASFINITLLSKMKTTADELVESTDDFTVKKVLKRPTTYYTQGIFLDDDGKTLIESGGLYGESVLIKMDYPSLKIVKRNDLKSSYFAEGVARCGDYVYQLTWRERKVLKYSWPDLDLVDTFVMEPAVQEGWGLASTDNPNELIASDGSANIYYLDCNNYLKLKRKITVRLDDVSVQRINALVFAEGSIWANQYYSNKIYKIDPASGTVRKDYSMDGLIKYELDNKTLTRMRLNSGDVLNGIAYDKTNKVFLVTGKKWGFYYEVQFK